MESENFSKNLGTFMFILFFFTINITAQLQELSLKLQAENSNEVEITGQFSNGTNIIKSGEPVTLILTVKNESAMPIFFADSFASKDFRITVRNERGEIISLTEYGKRMKNRTSFSYRRVNLESGKTRESKMGLDKVFDITVRGKYFLTASRAVMVNRVVDANGVVQQQGNWVQVMSKEIEFIVE